MSLQLETFALSQGQEGSGGLSDAGTDLAWHSDIPGRPARLSSLLVELPSPADGGLQGQTVVPVVRESTCSGLCFQNVGSVRQLLYDFPWSNVGKLVFVVSQLRHHTLFQTHSPKKHFPYVFFFLNAYFSDDETQTPPGL